MKFLKHTGTMVLASTLLLTAAPVGVWANREPVQERSPWHLLHPLNKLDESTLDAKVTKEQALERAKSYITLPDDYTLQSISLNANYGMNGQNIPIWNISYSKKVKERNYGIHQCFH